MIKRSITRRSVLAMGGSLSLAAILGGCSTAAPGTGGATAEGAPEMVLWTWPEGFAASVLESVSGAFPEINLRQDVIGGDFKQKLSTTLQAGSGLPSITGIKGEDIAFFASQADYFVDLNTLGAEDAKGDYLDWKWAQATTVDGRQLGIPIDIGPTALFYRFDIFEKYGLPAEPEALASAIRTWEEYFALGSELLGKAPDTYLVRYVSGLFDTMVKQSGKNFVSPDGAFIGDQDHIRTAWDTALKAHTLGISGGFKASTADSQAAVANGQLPADLGASWHLADLMVDAPDTAGKWHVCAHPGEATNNGGSFLGIPAGTTDAEQAFKVILHILNSENQIVEYLDKGNFPAHSTALGSQELRSGVDFLGGQVGGEVFAAAAKTVRPLYEHAYNSTIAGPYTAELDEVESNGKDPETAWQDAVAAAKRLAEQNGLSL